MYYSSLLALGQNQHGEPPVYRLLFIAKYYTVAGVVDVQLYTIWRVAEMAYTLKYKYCDTKSKYLLKS
jgi:hypothetical protein